jgi:phenylpropionate dioxygenase-like ring-hydroxylating dioxygenase large terminal subunit
VLDREDWGEALTAENLRMKQVKVDTWGGWVWINMDPDCEPLLDYLKPAAAMLDPFELEKMRFKWRQWIHFPCNWKTALEAFNESYHVDATHPQLARWGSMRFWSRAEGKHGWHGVAGAREGAAQGGSGMAIVRSMADQDVRVAMADQIDELMTTLDATTTATFQQVAARLKDELPAGASPEEVAGHLMAEAAKADAERGVPWPHIDPDHMQKAGADWHLFPNSIVLPSLTTALCYRARPNGYDPNSCTFEVYVLERFPEGQEPQTEWTHAPEPTAEHWRLILSQDFQNMAEVQRGMRSRGFPGARPSPVAEVPVIHFHRMLAEYMGAGEPEPLL